MRDDQFEKLCECIEICTIGICLSLINWGFALFVSFVLIDMSYSDYKARRNKADNNLDIPE